MKEYISEKFEFGEDDKVFFRVIIKVISFCRVFFEVVLFGGVINMVVVLNLVDNKVFFLINMNESELFF